MVDVFLADLDIHIIISALADGFGIDLHSITIYIVTEKGERPAFAIDLDIFHIVDHQGNFVV